MAARGERLGENQRRFRAANQRLSEIAERNLFLVDDQTIPYLCECSDEECFGRIEVTLSEYEGAHVGGGDYFILAGHPRIKNEEIIGITAAYDIVRKS